MRKHTVRLSDQELRMIVAGLDSYVRIWHDYGSRRARVPDLMRGVRNNSADEKLLQETCRVDVLAAASIVKRAEKLRDHLAALIDLNS